MITYEDQVSLGQVKPGEVFTFRDDTPAPCLRLISRTAKCGIKNRRSKKLSHRNNGDKIRGPFKMALSYKR